MLFRSWTGVSVPRVMLKSLATAPQSVPAGGSFTLSFSLVNMSKKARVNNLKVSLSQAEGAFLPAEGSSSLYVPTIKAGGTNEQKMTFHALPTLENRPYAMTLTVEYEDTESNAFCMMYYFVPKQAGRPVYSYRLSVVHFWALIFTYMWAGSHHLHYTALPDWTQSLGMVLSLILFAPSWGGMINGIMTLSGAWDKLRTDPILKFLIVSLSFYGMSTFELRDRKSVV